LAEIGANMDQFPDGDPLSSGAGICPGNNRTAGKSKSSHIQKANKFLVARLVEAAWGATRQKGSAAQRKFHRWLRKLGKKKAAIAICHHQLQVVWSVLQQDRPFVEADPTVLQTMERQKQIRHHANRLRQLGADEGAVAGVVERLLADEPAVSPISPREGKAAETSNPTCPPRQKCTPPKKASRPLARGVLGFRLRNYYKNLYSNGKEPTGTTFNTPPPKTTKHRGPTRKKAGAHDAEP